MEKEQRGLFLQARDLALAELIAAGVLSILNIPLGITTSLVGFGLFYFTSEARSLPYRILKSQISFLNMELRSRQQPILLIPSPSNPGMGSLTT